jgi:hypothetical protein
MDKSEIKRKVKNLLAFGTGKSEVYSELSGPGVKDSQLAWAIASYPDQALYDRYKNLVRALVALLVLETITWLVSVVISWISLPVGSSTRSGVLLTGVIALLPTFFAWRFYLLEGGRYSAYISFAALYLVMYILEFLLQLKLSLLAIIWGLGTGVMVPQVMVKPFIPGFTGELIGLALAVVQIGFVWYVKRKLFPDLGFFGARKSNGRYAFSS